MKLVEIYARVRHAVLIEGISARAAADRFGINARTVTKMLRFSVPPGYVRSKPPFRPKLDEFVCVIDAILAADKARYTTMTLAPGEFIRRVLLHVLPKGFHRIRHAGFLASSGKAENIAKARALLAVQASDPNPAGTTEQATAASVRTCPCCGGAMHIVETFERGETPRHRAEPSRLVIRIDTS